MKLLEVILEAWNKSSLWLLLHLFRNFMLCTSLIFQITYEIVGFKIQSASYVWL
jgi:hypothetical protein